MSAHRPTLLWPAVHEAALASLPAALAAMGFTRAIGPLPRGGVPALLPAWTRVRVGIASRPEAAARNREKARWPVRLCIRDADRLAVNVCTVSGEWCGAAGGARGESLIDLAAMTWGQPWAKAGFRLAREVGMGAVPHAG